MKFQLVKNQSPMGTSFSGNFVTSLTALQNAFGPGISLLDGDGKVINEWVFRGPKGVIVTLYDWKHSPGLDEQYDWHIGSKRQVECLAFQKWLKSELSDSKAPPTYKELNNKYLELMDEERAISQKWELGKLDRKKARVRIQKIWDERNAIMDKIESTVDKGRE
jgi:hypothetical protein